MTVRVIQGDCREALKGLPDASVHAVVIDPPYALVSIVKRFGKPGAAPAQGDVYARASAGFMGKAWDTGETAFAAEFWAEVLRVLKPGGHVAAFSGARTYHRLACAIEDAGFEIRDQLAWVYGSGFPKSHDVAKGIAKRRTEDVAPVREVCRFVRAAMDSKRLKSRHLTEHFGDCDARLIDHWAARDSDSQPALPTPAQWEVLKRVLGLDDSMDGEVERLNARKGQRGARWTNAEVVGESEGAAPGFGDHRFDGDRTLRALDAEAASWEGWGTALKPAWEPICLARKPLDGSVAATVLAHGCGALNIDGCRVDHGEDLSDPRSGPNAQAAEQGYGYSRTPRDASSGRWPANIVHDGSGEVLAAFPEAQGQSGIVTGREPSTEARTGHAGLGSLAGDHEPRAPRADSGSAARFFYSALAE